jgi:CheY-like chemotaxis protein
MGRKNVFVIDDELQVQNLFSEALSRHGHMVSCASDGESAINKLEGVKPDVIFLDLKLPGMNGVQTLEGIRKLHPKVPVVIITAYPRDSLVDGAMRLGVFACLVKPFSMMDVNTILETMDL